MGTKKSKANETVRRYRVARAFRHGGTLITRSAQLADVPQPVLEDRVKRGYIEDRLGGSSDPTPAAKAKE